MRIIGIERDQSACNNYRIVQPLYKLRQHGLADTLTIGEWELHTPDSFKKVMESDIVLFQRPMNVDWFKFIKMAQEAGKIIVVDYDDDPFNTNPFNPYYKWIGVKEWSYEWPDGTVDNLWTDKENGFDIERNIIRQDMFRASFKRADLVTTTTDNLAGVFKQFNDNTIVLPNVIDPYYLNRFNMAKSEDEIRIGYQGGVSHYEDIYMVKDALVEVLKKYRNTKFIYFGDFRFKGLFKDIPQSRIEHHSWVQFIAYFYKLPLMNIDIGLCPLVDNEFNRNKSSIKYLDYAATGSATVAQDIPPYKGVIKNGETGFLANTKEEWVEALSKLIENKKLRNDIQDNAYKDVMANHNVDKEIHRWKDVYEKLLNQKV